MRWSVQVRSVGLDNVPVYLDGFTDSPFEFTKSNEDTMRQLFAKIKQMA